MRKLLKQNLIFSLCLALALPAGAADWPGFKRDMRRTGFSREQAYPALTPAWTYANIQGEIRSSPVVAGGKVFIGGRDGSVWAFHADSGLVAWQYSTQGYVDAVPAVAEGIVYVPSLDGNLYAFYQENGEEPLWTYNSGSKDMSSPVVVNGIVYWTTGHPGTVLLAVNAKTGGLVWQQDISDNSLSSPAVESGVVAVGSNDGQVYAFDAATGASRWSAETDGRMEFASLAGDGQGYFYAVAGGDDGRLFAWDALTGVAKAGFPVTLVDVSAQAFGKPGSEVSSVAVANGKIFVAMTGVTAPDTVELQLFCRSAADGSEVWAPQVIGTPPETLSYTSTPAVANDVVYVGSGDGNLYAFNAADGNLISATDLDGPMLASPAVANGRVFAATLDGRVIALQAQSVAAIASPTDNAIVGGTITVRGLAAGPAFQNYTVEYGVGESPASWTPLVSPQAAQINEESALTQWDTSALAPQVYSLRLSVASGGVSPPESTAYSTFEVDPTYARNFVEAGGAEDVAAPDGTKVAVTPGALAQNDFVTVRKSTNPSSSVPEGAAPTGAFRRVAFDMSSTLPAPVTLTVPYKESEVEGVSPASLKLFRWTGTGWEVAPASVVDMAAQTVSAPITAPGLYKAFESRAVSTDQDFTYTHPDGAEVYVPAGAFSQSDHVNLTRHTSGDFLNVRLPANLVGLPSAWEFTTGSSSTKFLKKVTIKLPYDESLLNGAPASRLRIFLWDPDRRTWGLVNGSRVDLNAKKVIAQVSHFSIYRAMAYLSAGPMLEKDKVYTYPNPARGDTVVFKTFLGDDASIAIEVFNVAGEKIARMTNEGTAGNVIETPWDISSIASGVYIYRIEAKNAAGGRAEVTKKLAVIH